MTSAIAVLLLFLDLEDPKWMDFIFLFLFGSLLRFGIVFPLFQ